MTTHKHCSCIHGHSRACVSQTALVNRKCFLLLLLVRCFQFKVNIIPLWWSNNSFSTVCLYSVLSYVRGPRLPLLGLRTKIPHIRHPWCYIVCNLLKLLNLDSSLCVCVCVCVCIFSLLSEWLVNTLLRKFIPLFFFFPHSFNLFIYIFFCCSGSSLLCVDFP